jgi:hypothetical protein
METTAAPNTPKSRALAAMDAVEIKVTIRVPPKKAPQAQKEFDKHLREFGLDPKGAQETKTRTALEYFAKTLKEAQS